MAFKLSAVGIGVSVKVAVGAGVSVGRGVEVAVDVNIGTVVKVSVGRRFVVVEIVVGEETADACSVLLDSHAAMINVKKMRNV